MKFISYFRASLRIWRARWVGVLIATLGLAGAYGLSVLAVFHMYDGMRSDAWLPGIENLYRVQTERLQDGKKAAMGTFGKAPPELSSLLKDQFPEVKSATRLVNKTMPVRIQGDTESSIAQMDWVFSDLDFPQLFQLPMVAGSLEEVFSRPGVVALSEKEAARYGGAAVIGQTLTVDTKGVTGVFKVVAIFKDLPTNTHFRFGAVGLLTDKVHSFPKWSYVFTYVRLNERANTERFAADFAEKGGALVPSPMANMTYKLKLEPVQGLRYYTEGLSWENMRPSLDRFYVNSLVAVAMLAFVIAGFNFVNVFTANNMIRAHEFGVRRSSGAGRNHLLFNALFEAGFLALACYGMGLLIAADISPYIANFTRAEVAVFDLRRVDLLLIGMIVAVALGVFAAAYPVLVHTRTSTHALLQQSQRTLTGQKGMVWHILVGVQALALVGTSFAATQIYHQVQHLLSLDRGFQRENIMFLDGTAFNASYEERKAVNTAFRESLLNQVKKLDGVEDAELIGMKPFVYSFFNRRIRHRVDGTFIEAAGMVVGRNYLKVMNIKPLMQVEGDWSLFRNPVAISESQLKHFGFADANEALGEEILNVYAREEGEDTQSLKIVAILPSIKDGNAKLGRPIIYELLKARLIPNLSLAIRYKAGTGSAVTEQVRTLWLDKFPQVKPKISYIDELIEKKFTTVRESGDMVAAFAGFCALLGFGGMYGMALHWLSSREREIALRRVHGASERQITFLVLRKMLTPVFLGGLISLVPTWYILSDWLTRYEDRAPLSVASYGSVLCLVLLFAGMLLMIHTRQALKKRPAYILQYE